MIAPHPTSHQEPRWRRLPEERPRQLIEAALDEFGEHGLAGARLDDIARRAGVSKGTIYLYFPNKEALFCEMIRQTVGETITHAEARAGAADSSATAQLVEYARALWETICSPTHEKLYRLVLGELRNFPALFQFFLAEVPLRSMAVVATLVRRGIASGEFRSTDPDAAARMLHALAVKHAIWCANREQIPFTAHQTDDEVFDQLMDFFLHAIRSPSASPAPTPAPAPGNQG